MFWKRKKIKQNLLFISIGGGINQIPLIEEAKRLGLLTIGVDTNLTAAGMHKCDIRIQESIDNYTEIFNKLEELMVDGEIAGILTKSYGPAIKTTAYIAEKLRIPVLPFDKVDDLINKEKMKNNFKLGSILSPDYIIQSYAHLLKSKIKLPYPFVIKPVIGHAKTNVQLIKSSKELHKYCINISNTNQKQLFLLEKFIPGDEIISIGIINKGKFYLVEITDKIKSSPPHFVDLMHILPSKYIDLWDQIQDIGQQVADTFNIYCSPLLMELIITENEEIHLIETAPEFGGEFISDTLIPESTGYNVISEAIKAVTNKNFSIPSDKKKYKNTIVIKYITGNNGILSSFNPITSELPGVIFSRIFKDIGSKIRLPETNHDRIGVIAAKGRTREEAIFNADNAIEFMNIRVTKDTGKSDKKKSPKKKTK